MVMEATKRRIMTKEKYRVIFAEKGYPRLSYVHPGLTKKQAERLKKDALGAENIEPTSVIMLKEKTKKVMR